MQLKAQGKHGWSLLLGLLLSLPAAAPVAAAPSGSGVEIAIGNPLPNALVGGRITLGVAYDLGMGRITAFTLLVDEAVHSSQAFFPTAPRGIHYIELDTRALTDGNHTLKVVAMGPRGLVAQDAVTITVRNGIAGGPDLTPPLVQFRRLMDGDTVSGKITIDLLAEDNTTQDLLVSIFVNRFPALLKNRPPYLLELDTAPFLDPATGRGTIRLEAWAYDRAENLGKARPITLNVVPAGASENQTRRQEDPTRAISRPALPRATAAAPQPLKTQPESTLVIPLGPGGRKAEPAPPAPAAAALAGPTPKLAPGERVPGARPLGSRPAIPAPGLHSEASGAARPAVPAPVPVGEAGRTALAGGKTAVPASPPRPRPIPTTARAVLPAPIRTNPAPAAPARMARALPPALPEARPVEPRPAASPRPEPEGGQPMAAPEPAAPRVAISLLPAPAAAPMPSPDGPRAVMPEPRSAPDDADPLIVVVDPTARPDANGRVRATVYRARTQRPTLPEDRTYRLRPGDTLAGVARRFGVTEKSIRVANAIIRPESLRPGEVIRVPGTFDVMVNRQRVAFDVNPRVENGIPLAPFRQIFEHAGGVVMWVPESREVRAATDTKQVTLKIGSREARVNQVVILMERAAFIESGRTIVPISFMEKALDLVAEYDPKNRTIHLVRR